MSSTSHLNLTLSPGRSNIGTMKSPPTKLLINHGKPNFVIKGSNNSGGNQNNNKNPSTKVKPNFVINRNASTKMNFTLKNGKPDNKNDCNEFIQTHKKINDKLINTTNEHILKESNNNINSQTNPVGNGLTSICKVNSPKQMEYSNIEKDRVINVREIIHGTNHNNPEKSTKIPGKCLPKQQSAPAKVMEKSVNNNGHNFKQRTVVSFSKDLSTERNNYPDTVKIVKTVENLSGKPENKEFIHEFSQLKFEIANNGERVFPILKPASYK